MTIIGAIFLGCRWYWPCFWIHPRIWSGFCRIVVIVVFMWCGFVRIHPPISPCLHPRRIACVKVYIFILFGCGFTIFDFYNTIWIHSRVCFGVGILIMTGLNCGIRLGGLSSPLFFILGAGSISHHFISFISAKIMTRYCKVAHLPLPIYLTGGACAGFSKKFLYRRLPL